MKEPVSLYEVDSEVFGADSFIRAFMNKVDFTKNEKDLLLIEGVFDKRPYHFSKPLTRAEWLSINGNVIHGRRLGERSAFLPESHIKLKGCNPADENKTFPGECLFFGNKQTSSTTIPYGILTVEQVMRELLGIAFFKKYGLQTNLTPVAVYPLGTGFCIAEKTTAEERIEARFDYEGLSLEKLLQMKSFSDFMNLNFGLGKEIGLHGVNHARYIYNKAAILADMNFFGGFRGLLNSNIGNDVIRVDQNGNLDLYLCDFDTFRVVDIPEKPDHDFLERFTMQCFVECAKSSLPFIHVVDTMEQAVSFYLNNSSLFIAYRRLFYQKAKDRNWDIDKIRDIEQEMIGAPVFRKTVGEIVLSIEGIKKLPMRKPIYKPH